MPHPGPEPQQNPGFPRSRQAPLLLTYPVPADPAVADPALAVPPLRAAAGAGPAPAAQAPATEVPAQERALRVIVCGETNAGKSTAINALLRGNVLVNYLGQSRRPPVLVTPGAAPGLYLRYQGQRTEAVASLDPGPGFADVSQCIVQTDLPALAGFEIIEMPAPADGDLSGAELEFIASADILIWVTIASQAWRLTERTVFERLGARRPAETVLVVSRADKLRSAADAGRIRDRLAQETAAFFGETVFLSGARGLIARSGTEEAAFAATAGAGLLAALEGCAGRIRAAGEVRPDAGSPGVELPAAELPAAERGGLEAEVVSLADWRSAPADARAAAAAAAQLSGAPARTAPQPPGPAQAAAGPPAERMGEEELHRALDSMEGLVAAGVTRLAGAEGLVVLAGETETAGALAEFCRSALTGHAAAFAADQDIEAAIVVMRARSLVFQVLPASGRIVFVLCDSISTGALRAAIVRLSTAVARHCAAALDRAV